MNIRHICSFVLIALTYSLQTEAQTVLYSESFETDGEGTRYTSNTFSFCSGSPGNNPDYFLRINSNPALPAGCTAGFGTALTNLQGSWYWASEDIRSSSPVLNGNPPGQINSRIISSSGFNNLKVSLFLATSNNNNVRWENSDSINVQASFDGVNYITVGRFMGDAVAGGRLRIDGNLDGAITAADPATLCDQVNFTKYTFNIPGTGANLRVRLDFDQIGGTEEMGIDLLEVTGVSTLPIKLLSFEGSLNSQKQAYIEWKTDEGSTADYFEIQKSRNGMDFDLLRRVYAGNQHLFRQIDEHTITGITFYRLKMKDQSGEESFSRIVAVASNSSNTEMVSIVPNPADDRAVITFTATQAKPAWLCIYNLSGRKVKTISLNLVNGQSTTTIGTKELTTGIYLLRLTDITGEILAAGKLLKN
jgi:Secretion system C-terminal sorting domain